MNALAQKSFEYIAELTGAQIAEVIDPIAENFPGRNAFALSEAEVQVIERVRQMCQNIFTDNNVTEDKFTIKKDAFGNLFVTLHGLERGHAIAAGSHADSVMNGGLFDGPAGVASAVSFLERLVKGGKTPKYDYTVIVLSSEESSPVTSCPCLGSAVAAGDISADSLRNMKYGLPSSDKVTLEHHFRTSRSDNQWEQVLEELEDPPINAETTFLWLELHPSQGLRQIDGGFDVGIVTHGIAGIQNRLLEIPASELKFRSFPETEQICRLTISATGRADHTGSAPHNSADRFNSDELPRKDALINVAKLLQFLAQEVPPTKPDGSLLWGLERTAPARMTGFTTIPHHQELSLLLSQSTLDKVQQALLEFIAESDSPDDFKIDAAVSLETNSNAQFLDTDQMSALLEVPLSVEKIAATLARKDQDGTLEGIVSSGCIDGRVRGTVTDFRINPNEGWTAKINIRKAGDDIGALIEQSVWKEVHSLMDPLEIDAELYSSIVSDIKPTMIPKEISDKLLEIAKDLGLKANEGPSMALHDTAIIGRIRAGKTKGILIGMIFATDSGGSHVPTEKISEDHMRAAVLVQHSALAYFLDVTVDEF